MSPHHTDSADSVNPTPEPSKAVNPLPYAPIPHALSRDRRLKDADIRVVVAILERLHNRASGVVANTLIAEATGMHVRSIPRCLRRLEAAGWIRMEGDGRKTYRRLTLVWRYVPTDRGVCPYGYPIKNLSEGKEELTSFAILIRGSLEALDRFKEGVQDSETVLLARLAELLATMSREGLSDLDRGRLVGFAATLTSESLMDSESHANHCSLCWLVAQGQVSPTGFLEPFRACLLDAPIGRIDNPGAYLTRAVQAIARGEARADIDRALAEELAHGKA